MVEEQEDWVGTKLVLSPRHAPAYPGARGLAPPKKSVFHTGRCRNETNKRQFVDVCRFGSQVGAEATMATADEEKQKLMEREEKAEEKQDKKDGTRCES